MTTASSVGAGDKPADGFPCLDGVGKITIDGTEYLLHEGESIIMPAGHPHAVYGQEAFKMLLIVVF